MYGIIATWNMSLEGVTQANKLLAKNTNSTKAILTAINDVENNEYFKSVGYGGLPNENGIVELDAAFMNGDNFNFGGVCSLRNIANPVNVAYDLSLEKVNNLLVANGAKKYAIEKGHSETNLLSKRAEIHYLNRLKENNIKINPYNGHDTVGMVCLDNNNSMIAATSTSGLFMKKEGRVGDSPIIGSGLYVDSTIGGASATGLGEDIMKGCISYEIVSLMRKHTPQEACNIAVKNLQEKLIKIRGEAGDISVIAMNNKGEFGASSTIKDFSIVVATSKLKPSVFLVKSKNNECYLELASKKFIDEYYEHRKKDVKLK